MSAQNVKLTDGEVKEIEDLAGAAGDADDDAGSGDAASSAKKSTAPAKSTGTKGVGNSQTSPNMWRRGEVRRIVHERCIVCLQAVQTDEQGNASVDAVGCMLDISSKGAGVLSDTRLAKGTKLVLELKSSRYPHQFLVTVMWCRELPSIGKIIKSTKPLVWRVGLLFDFRTREEVEIMKLIAESL